MTMLIANTKFLAIDRKMATTEYPPEYQNASKIIHQDAHMAIAIVGVLPAESALGLLTSAVRSIILEFELTGGHEFQSYEAIDSGTSVYILTKRGLYIYRDGESIPFNTTSPNRNYYAGTGEHVAKVCMNKGLSLEKTFELASTLKTDVSSNFDVVRSYKLKKIKEKK